MVPIALIFDAVEAFLGSAWRFVTTPPWSYVAMAAAAVLAVWLYGNHEYDRGVAADKKAHTVYVTKEVVRQVTVVKTVVAASDAKTGQHKAEDEKNKTIVRTIYEHDQALPDAHAVCVDPVDADRLRAIR